MTDFDPKLLSVRPCFRPVVASSWSMECNACHGILHDDGGDDDGDIMAYNGIAYNDDDECNVM